MTGPPRIRRATREDVDALLEIKRKLAISPEAGEAPRGGFLLGSSADRYREYTDHAHVLVLESGTGDITGFGIGLPDALLRRSDLWDRRDDVQWSESVVESVGDGRVGYFDQLAVLPVSRFHAPALALSVVMTLISAAHRQIFATVVVEPVRNLASLPLLTAVGARAVGRISEAYDGVGRVVSDVYRIEARSLESAVTASPIKRRLDRVLAAPESARRRE